VDASLAALGSVIAALAANILDAHRRRARRPRTCDQVLEKCGSNRGPSLLRRTARMVLSRARITGRCFDAERPTGAGGVSLSRRSGAIF